MVDTNPDTDFSDIIDENGMLISKACKKGLVAAIKRKKLERETSDEANRTPVPDSEEQDTDGPEGGGLSKAKKPPQVIAMGKKGGKIIGYDSKGKPIYLKEGKVDPIEEHIAEAYNPKPPKRTGEFHPELAETHTTTLKQKLRTLHKHGQGKSPGARAIAKELQYRSENVQAATAINSIAMANNAFVTEVTPNKIVFQGTKFAANGIIQDGHPVKLVKEGKSVAGEEPEPHTFEIAVSPNPERTYEVPDEVVGDMVMVHTFMPEDIKATEGHKRPTMKKSESGMNSLEDWMEKAGGYGPVVTDWAHQFMGTSMETEALELVKKRRGIDKEFDDFHDKEKPYDERNRMTPVVKAKYGEKLKAQRKALEKKRDECTEKMYKLEGQLLDHRIEESKRLNKSGMAFDQSESLEDWVFKAKLPSATADITPEKARQILHDGEVHGKPLTEQQRKFFGAIGGHLPAPGKKKSMQKTCAEHAVKADDGKPGESLEETSTSELKATFKDLQHRLKAKPDDQAMHSRLKAIGAELSKRGIKKSIHSLDDLEDYMEKAKYIKRTGSPGAYKYEYAKEKKPKEALGAGEKPTWMEKAGASKVQSAITSFLKRNPKPDDTQVHALANKLGVEVDDIEEKIYSMLGSKLNKADKIPGGLAAGKKPSDFNPKQLTMGVQVELEHTKDRAKAREIAMDHLMEDPAYYTHLKEMERKHAKSNSEENTMQKALPGAGKPGGSKTPPKEYREGGATKKTDYADPANYKYPIDTEQHVRAAISYFSKPKNAGVYSVPEQKAIWGRIKRAAKKYKIELSEESGPPSVQKSLDGIDELSDYLEKANGGLPTHQQRMGGPKSQSQGASQDGGSLEGTGMTSGSIDSAPTPGTDGQGGVTGVSAGKKQKLSEDDTEESGQMKPHKKPIEKTRKSMDPASQRDMTSHERAVLVSRLKKGEEDIIMHPFVIHATDEQAAELAKGGEFYEGPAPEVARKNPLIEQGILCKGCDQIHSAALTACPHCGSGIVSSRPLPSGPQIGQHMIIEKSLEPPRLRPRKQDPDLVLPNGVAFDEVE